MSTWLRQHPVIGFVLLAYGISYLIGIPVLFAVSAWAPGASQPLDTYLSRVLVVYGPGLAALLLAWITRGGEGCFKLIARLLPKWAELPWAMGILIVGGLSSSFALLLTGVELRELLSVVRANAMLLLIHFVLQILIVSVGEELGWRGWLLPRLLERTDRLRATLLLALLWGVWHGPLLFSGFTTTVMFLFGVAGLSVLFTWLWAATCQRLFLVVVAHATVNTPMFFWEQVGSGGADSRLWMAWYILEAGYAVAALVVLVFGWRWWTGRSA